MRLTKLTLTNFRNHAASVFDLTKKINIFVGKNAAGKTSILDGISYLLTGRNVRTKKSGEGSVEMITFGESRAILTGEIEGIGKITRTIPHSLQINNWDGSLRDQQSKLYDILKTDGDTITCALNGSEFLNMSADEQKNFIFNILGLKATKDRIRNEFIKWAKENNIDNPETIYKLMPGILTFDGNHERIDDAYKYFIGLRKSLKKEIKELEVKAKDFISDLPKGITIDHKDVTIAKIQELEKSKNNMMVTFGKIQAMNNQRIKLEESVKAKEPTRIKESFDDLIKEKTIKIKKYEELMKVEIEKSSKIKANKILLNKLKDFSGNCPIFPDTTCSITSDKIQVFISDIEKSINSLIKEIDNNTIAIKTITDEGKILDKKIENKRIEIKYDLNVKTALKELKDIEKLGGNTDIQRKINEIDARLTKGHTILTAIRNEELKIKLKNDALNSLESKTKDLDKVEILSQAFGPKGIKTIMLNRALIPLQKKISEKMSILTNNEYTLELRVNEKEFNIFIISNGVERSIKHLSSSEKLRVSIIMQDAINSLVGLRFMIIDNVDMLDDDNKKYLWSLLGKIESNYDSIIVLSTGIRAPKPGNNNMNIYFLEKK